MRVLLDTHAFLWFTAGDSRLPASARQLIEDPANEKYISLASCWEISIKVSLGRLSVSMPLHQLFHDAIEGNGLECLSISRSHLLELPNLQMTHRDPFDRLLVVQTKVEGLTLLSRDDTLDGYGIKRIW
jgi:PIN domain nuclease of toxin-antitoxin system